MSAISLISIVRKNFKLLTPQSLGLQFSECQQKWNISIILLISIVQKNFKLLTPPKVWFSGFQSVGRNGISALAIMKKLKNGCHFINIDRMEKFQITNPPKVWVSSFLLCMLMEMEYHRKTGDANFLFF